MFLGKFCDAFRAEKISVDANRKFSVTSGDVVGRDIESDCVGLVGSGIKNVARRGEMEELAGRG